MENKKLRFNFEDLLLYQKSLDFIQMVYSLSSEFPKTEIYALTNQFRRASNSIALNIAEGSGASKLQFIRYLNIAKGSIHECVVCVTLASKLKYINQSQDEELRVKLVELSKMCSGLISKLKET